MKSLSRKQLIERVDRESAGRCYVEIDEGHRVTQVNILTNTGWSFGGDLHTLISWHYWGTGETRGELYAEAYRDLVENLPDLVRCHDNCEWCYEAD